MLEVSGRRQITLRDVRNQPVNTPRVVAEAFPVRINCSPRDVEHRNVLVPASEKVVDQRGLALLIAANRRHLVLGASIDLRETMSHHMLSSPVGALVAFCRVTHNLEHSGKPAASDNGVP
jgi:hypothetical protein